MKSFAKVCLILITAVTLSAYTAHAQADAASTNKPPAEAAKPRPRGTQYNGTIAKVDSDTKIITITKASGDSLTIHLTSKTRIKKDGEPATLADATVGQKARGTMRKDESGDWVASTLNIGEMKKAAPPAAAPKQ